MHVNDASKRYLKSLFSYVFQIRPPATSFPALICTFMTDLQCKEKLQSGSCLLPHPLLVLYHKLQISGIQINEVFTVFSQIMQ